MQNYDDIIHLARPESAAHPPMPRAARAAQFSPFAALTGYESAIRETARLTDREIEPDEDELAVLDAKLEILAEHVKARPRAVFTHFVPDPRKAGGAYRQTEGEIVRIDPTNGTVHLADGTQIPIPRIHAIESPLFAEAGYE